jgi:hypothetical protein
MVWRMTNWKEYAMKWSWSNQNSFLAFVWTDWGKWQIKKPQPEYPISFTKIQTKHLLNTSLEHYGYTNQLNVSVRFLSLYKWHLVDKKNSFNFTSPLFLYHVEWMGQVALILFRHRNSLQTNNLYLPKVSVDFYKYASDAHFNLWQRAITIPSLS